MHPPQAYQAADPVYVTQTATGDGEGCDRRASMAVPGQQGAWERVA